jgi:hypothetical protein
LRSAATAPTTCGTVDGASSTSTTIGDYAGDVVGSAAPQGQLDERLAGRSRIGVLAQRRLDGVGADDVGEPVAAQQVAVASAGLAHRQVGLDVGATVQCLQDQRLLRMVACLLCSDPPVVDQRLHPSVVAGDLLEPSVAQDVPARVTHMDQPQPTAGAQQGGERRAHSVQ